MVTFITEQLQKQSLDDSTYRGAFTLRMPVPEAQVTQNCWTTYELLPESRCWQLCSPSKHSLPDELSSFSSLTPQSPVSETNSLRRLLVPSTSVTDLSFKDTPPPPPPKRHCRSLSVPEDLSRCPSAWKPSGSKVWTPVKRRCHSGGGAPTTSSLHSCSSPTFFSLALSPESPLPWSFPWEPADATHHPHRCSSSPAPLCPQRRFSLSPVHVREAAAHFLPPPPAPTFPTSACSTPSLSRRSFPAHLPRCHSQPCDLRKPGLKRRHDSDALPCIRPGLDFSKMTQTRSNDPLSCVERASAPCRGHESALGDFRASFSPAEGVGRSSIGPLSESEEEEEEEGHSKADVDAAQQSVFERDCTELDLTLIEEN